jgi:hypothetical protein
MKNRNNEILILLLTLCVSPALAYDNLGIKRNNNTSTATPKPTKSGLIVRPKINYGTAPNLMITGNVAGSGNFQGAIPYNSQYELWLDDGLQGASSLNSFIRRSAGTPYYNSNETTIEPYFLPTKTATTINRIGSTTGLKPPKVRFSGGTGNYKLPPLPKVEYKSLIAETRPIATDINEFQRAIEEQRALMSFQKKVDDALLQQALDVEKEVDEISDKLLLDDSLKPHQPDEPEKPEREKKPEDYNEIYEQMQKKKQAELDEAEDAYRKKQEELREKEQQEKEKEAETQDAEKQGTRSTPFDKWLNIGKDEQKKVLEILGHHKTYKSFAEAKFSEYMMRASRYLKEGKYYKAADTYTLAAVYDSGNGEIFANKAVALFAAGEYMSASFFLTRGLTLSPEYARRRIDLVDMLGSRDVIDDRLVEMNEWVKKSGSGELSFLMAYIYRNINNTVMARTHINMAANKIPENEAVKLLQKAIDPGMR